MSTLPWGRKWQPTPVFPPGGSHGQRSLADYSHGVAKSQTRLATHTHTGTLSVQAFPCDGSDDDFFPTLCQCKRETHSLETLF